MNIQQLSPGDFTIDPRLQMRAAMSQEAIDEYATNVSKLPPCKVIRGDNGENWIITFHRLFAHKKAGTKSIPCEIVPGTFRDALIAAAGENSEHGVRRSNDDKRKTVETVFGWNGFTEMSDRAIADICNVSPDLVGAVRLTLKKTSTDGNDSSDSGGTRTGKDGKTRKPKRKPGAKSKPVCKRCKSQGYTTPRPNCPVCLDLNAKADERRKAAEEKEAAKRAKEGLKANRQAAEDVRKFFDSFKAVDQRNQKAVETVSRRAAELCDAVNRLWESEK